jgi:polysaccharide biosynthesis/export protein
VRQLAFIVGGLFILSLCLIAEEIKQDDYVIGEQDILAINVWKEPELSVKELVVRPDGKISLPLVNDIQASGLTPKQLREQIAEKLKEFVASPNVNVAVIKTVSHTVSVVGQVNKPGVYAISSPTTVLDLLARVGGLAEFAKAKEIKILRNEKGKIQQFPFDYKKVIKGKDLFRNILLKNGDTILVP